jgi:carboxymethylenebutenolidase
MCDEDTVEENIAYLKAARLSRRQFNTLTTGAALAMMLPRAANALTVTEHNVEVVTPDGLADCYFVHPADGKHPGVIVWPDILGLRPAFRTMGKRLAESGYSVLVINPYYRTGKAPLVAVGATSQDEAVRNKIFPIARQLNARTTTSDARSFVSFLDQQSAVDQDRMIGTTGYCMGGSMTMLTAAAMPDRIGAGASFHGSRLVTDKEESPHLLVPGMKAHFLVAIAASDDERDPEAKNVLRKSFDEAGLPAEIEVYEGAMHGWCSIDSPVYHEVQAEKAWARLLALFDTALT